MADTEPMNHVLDGYITVFEVRKAIFNAKRNKSPGFDEIPADVFRNDSSVSYLHILFNVSFRSDMMPSDWVKGIIHPIPKSSTADRRDPLSYRGITLANSIYKIYCHVLNERLTKWVEANHKVLEIQNGFRSQRSTIDQIMSLVNIIDTRKKHLCFY